MRISVEPSFVKGLFSIFSGKTAGTEDLAYALKINPNLLDTCILLSNLSRSKNTEKSIEELKSHNSFRNFFKTIKASMD